MNLLLFRKLKQLSLIHTIYAQKFKKINAFNRCFIILIYSFNPFYNPTKTDNYCHYFKYA